MPESEARPATLTGLEFKLGEMPTSFPEIQQYFKRLSFYLKATGKCDNGKAVLLATCGNTAFALMECFTD